MRNFKDRGFSIRKTGFTAVAASLLAAAALFCNASRAGESNNAAHPNVVLPTLGGKQFWADELFFHQWRIQRNAVTGHYRLLDDHDRRQAWGTYEQCRAKLQEIRRERHLSPMKGKAVVVLHGLGRSRASMESLCRCLRERGRFEVFNVTYPSTRDDITAHAASLGRIVANLDGIEEINFVAHSMGNVVVRCYLGGADQKEHGPGEPREVSGRPDPRIQRFVMLAPPNHGSLAALVLADLGAFKEIAGESGQQLGRDWEQLEGKLATPAFDFGIIAGGKGDGRGFNPLLRGDNDGTISVQTTRLAGAADFLLVPKLHSFLMDDAKVQEHVLRFLQKGCFVSPKERQPIPRPKSTPSNPKSQTGKPPS
jgi:pimeloyl-ACP methyl ester carboxylesterase